ncbi:MAG: MtrB/PioB family decaheme-associated outer membrane protein [Gammaproteobacteria bacterium]|nr:MtrB/PioB family decaheme-associated outer membrane protein [Gammaproteobacteria bacterium]
MKTASQLSIRAALPLMIGAALSVNAQPEVDTSQWDCKFCEFEEGFSGDAEIGAGYVWEDDFKFGEYTGLVDEGGYAIFNARATYSGEDADYLDLTATELGLDARSLTIEGGRQGSYRLNLRYDELPHNVSDTVRTPFTGMGSEDLTLPPGWVDAGTTAAMTSLDNSLRDAELETHRERLAVGAAFVPADNWEFGVKVRRDTKEGTQSTSGAFFLNAAQLIQPIDYVTDEVEAFVAYAQREWQVRVKYYVSSFENDNDALRWDNPFTPFTAGADSGELALPPDNEFHQVGLAVGYQFSSATNAGAELAVGRMRQNEDFLAATTNPNLTTALPRDSLDGEVDTVNAVLKLTSRLSEQLRLNAAYRYDDRDNQTPQDTYSWVSTDTFSAATARENQPYSFTRQTLDVSADYRVDPRTKLSVGLDHENVERTLQEADETRENALWTKLSARAGKHTQASVRFAHAERDVSSYEPVPETQPAQNPLLRKFYLADRSRDEAEFRVNTTPGESLSLGFTVGVADDDYSESTVGLTDSRLLNVGADATTMLSVDTSVHAFLDHQTIKSAQAGSNAFSVADWRATQTDTINTLGIGVQHRVSEQLDVGADLAASESSGKINVNNSQFPDLEADLYSLKVHATYRLQSGISVRAAYWHESYDSQDWSLDGVEPDTIRNVLTLGDESPSYDVDVLLLSLRYKF